MAQTRRSGRLQSSPHPLASTPSIGRKRRAADQQEPRSEDSGLGLQTPQRTSKRVRFSGSSAQASGLTPFVRRATLSPKESALATTPSKRGRPRLSLPTDLLTPLPSPFAEARIIQFTPLRQEIDSRQRRRLRRSHLSELQNDITAEDRLNRRQNNQQIDNLQSEIRDLRWELEQQRQFGIHVSTEEAQRVDDLEAELARLRHARDVEKGASPAPTEGDPIFDSTVHDDAMATNWDDDNMPSSPLSRQRQAAPDTPISLGTFDFEARPFMTDAIVQASLPSTEHEAQIQTFEDAVARLTRESSDAKSAFETLRNVLVQLGFEPSHTDEGITRTIQNVIRSTRMQLEGILPGETVCGTENGKLLLEEMIRHIRSLLFHNDTKAQVIRQQQMGESALRGQFNTALVQKQETSERLSIVEAHRTSLLTAITKLEEDIEVHQTKLQDKATEVQGAKDVISALHTAADEKTTTIERLQAALNKYRAEMSDLEGIIGTLEQGSSGKNIQLDQLKAQLQRAEARASEQRSELARLQKGIDDAAFGLTRLARPGLDNVTRRASKRVDAREDFCTEVVDRNDEGAKGGSKRDSGVSVVR